MVFVCFGLKTTIFVTVLRSIGVLFTLCSLVAKNVQKHKLGCHCHAFEGFREMFQMDILVNLVHISL